MLEREKQMDELTSDLRRLKDQLSIANRRAEAAERDLKGAKAFQPKIKPKPQNELGVDGQGMGVSKKEMDDKIDQLPQDVASTRSQLTTADVGIEDRFEAIADALSIRVIGMETSERTQVCAR